MAVHSNKSRWMIVVILWITFRQPPIKNNLETFAMYNSRTRFVIFLFRDPHLLEGRKRGQDGTTNPNGVFSFWWSDNLDFDCWWCKSGDFLLHTISNTWNTTSILISCFYTECWDACNDYCQNNQPLPQNFQKFIIINFS